MRQNSIVIGMDSFHKLNIPLIHLTTRSEKEDQEEESDCIIKSNSNAESDSRSLIDPSSMIPLDSNTISVKHDTHPSTSNIISDNSFSFCLIN